MSKQHEYVGFGCCPLNVAPEAVPPLADVGGHELVHIRIWTWEGVMCTACQKEWSWRPFDSTSVYAELRAWPCKP